MRRFVSVLHLLESLGHLELKESKSVMFVSLAKYLATLTKFQWCKVQDF